MIIKHADDRRSEIAKLQSLLSDSSDPVRNERIKREMRRIRSGIRGEEEAAYEMKVLWGDNPNWMIVHDLRLECGGRTAQIDHLILNRWMEMWICESKHFAQGVSINEHGEFSTHYGSRRFGLPSPIEQLNKQISILQRIFETGLVESPRRLGFAIAPQIKGLVLVSKQARIVRPKAPIEGIEAVVKTDQLLSAIDIGLGDRKVSSLARAVGQETIEKLARALVRIHKPIRYNWAARFGAGAAASLLHRPVQQMVGQPTSQGSRLACHSCGKEVTHRVAEFCRGVARFSGSIYCMKCQRSPDAGSAVRASERPQAEVVPLPQFRSR